MKQQETAGLTERYKTPAHAGAGGANPVRKVALESHNDGRYRHRANHSQAEAARARGYRKGRGAADGPAGRFEVAEHVAFDDGWESGQARLEDLIQRPTTVSEDRAKSVLTFNESPDLGFDRSVNPYRGCEHGCTYCYARPSHAFMGLSAGLDFETKLFAKYDVARLLEDALRKPDYQVAPIALGTNTDPYQPIERELKLTSSILAVLDECNHPVTIVTKSAGILRDLDRLTRMARRGLVSVGLSVTTLDAELSRLMEPRCSSPARRIDTIRHLSEAGIPVRVMASPMIPGLNNCELENILEAARKAGAKAASMIPLRLPLEVKDVFRDWLEANFPDRAKKVMSQVTSMHGGQVYRSNFGERMRGSGPLAHILRHRFQVACGRYGLSEHLRPLVRDAFRPPQRAGDQLSLI
ncbi:PA0069 family radical SAM protein [Alphaproteobacteria bacterium]|nr:PA0069 family radical SAM protein [Alphaproteobacteria bacterium]